MIRFGPAGNSNSFYADGYKHSLDACQWIHRWGLNAYEYQCTRGVRVSYGFCNTLGAQAQRYDIQLSIHAPYYINLASLEAEIREHSGYHILKSLEAAVWMGARRVIFHPGALSGQSREEAMKRAEDTLAHILVDARKEGYLDMVALCPETMGKTNQFGHLGEVIQLCRLDEALYPAIDFAHLHALYGGGMNTAKDFAAVFDKIAGQLGQEKLQGCHIHFSPVEYTKGGERRHRTLQEKEYGPDFYELAHVLVEKRLEPVIICESAGTQAEDAVEFQRIYDQLWRERKKNKTTPQKG